MCSKIKHNFAYKIFKKTFAVTALLGAFTFASHMTAYAEETEKIATEKVIPEKVITVKVGYCENYGIISTLDSNSFTGYGYDYLSELSKYTNWAYEFVLVQWEEGIEKLKSGEIDFFGPMQYSGEREKYFTYPQKATGIENGVVYALKDNKSFYYEDFERFDNMRVATMVNNYHNISFDNYCRKNGIKVNYYFYKDTTELVEAIENDETDVFIAGSMISDPNVKIVGRYSVDDFFFATSKENTELMEEYNLAVEKMEKDNTYFTAKLHSKYYNDDIIGRAAFTKKESDFIANSPTIKIVYDANWSPIEYSDKKTGEFDGINADILKLISEYSGLKFEYIRSDSKEDALMYMEEGKADATAGHFGSEGRKILTTNEYIDIPFVMVGESGIAMKEKTKIAISRTNAEIVPEIIKNYSDSEVVIFNSLEESLKAIYDNKADVALVNSYTFDETLKSGKFDKLSILTVSPIIMSMEIGISNSQSPLLRDILNKTISHISYGEKNTIIMDNTINKEYKIPLSVILKNYSTAFIVLILLVSVTVIAYITTNKKINMAKLQKIAYFDSLTGIRNVDKFKIDMEAIFRKYGCRNYIVVYADIDKFKYINDVLGYDAGNDVLKMVSEIITNNLKEHEIVARVYADNYIFLMKCEKREEIEQRLESLEKELVKIICGKYNYLQLYFNVGIYAVKFEDRDINIIVDNANLARKTVKGSHQSTFAFYDEALHNEIIAQTEIESTMKEAFENHEFIVYLQPKYNLINEKIAGAEALVRWDNPIKGLIQPTDFIPIFERNGFVVNIDLFVFEEVCKKIKEWQDMGLDPIPPISVNLSRIHLSNENLAKDLYNITKKYEISPRNIEIEITESTIYGNVETLLSIMNQLQSKGFLISMDDFGTGYSSLNLLKDIPINILKLDKEFLNSASDTERGQKVVSNMVYMAQNLNIKVVAEGVETRQQASFLREINCDMAQGFYFARPMPISEFETLFFGAEHENKEI